MGDVAASQGQARFLLPGLLGLALPGLLGLAALARRRAQPARAVPARHVDAEAVPTEEPGAAADEGPRGGGEGGAVE